MNFAKIARIVRREYLESVRKKSFLFGLVATPAIMLGMIFLPLLSSGLLGADRIAIAVRDETGGLGERLRGAEWPSGEGARTRPEFVVHGPDGPTPAELDARVQAGELSGWLLLPSDLEETGHFEYRSESVTNVVVLQALESQVDRILAEKRAGDLGLTEEQVDRLLTSARMRTIRLGEGGGASEADFSGVYLKAVALVMILFFALIPTGNILMRSVIEEKANRVIEVLISSVSPLELMIGKIVGLGAVGLTLLGVWALVGGLLSLNFGRALPVAGGELLVFVAFFFPGYFLFAALLGGIGSICNSEREAQPFVTPISLTLIFPVMIGFAIAQNPDHVAARILSFFPPLTPSLVLFRYAIKPPPLAEMVAAWSVLAAATAAMFVISARVFRLGILMTGKRPTLPEMWRWVRAAG